MGSESIASQPGCEASLQVSIAKLASIAATDVGMHGLLASQSCYHSVLPLVCVHCGPVEDFFITKQTSLHPFDFVRNLFHLLVNNQFNKTKVAYLAISAEHFSLLLQFHHHHTLL